ncbi:hypothetical protein JZ751_024446 [Albula glossodonta]|uniref:Uncharacterized protein n=1 Tax=Albula glossodonta TaxID=121402 RepID=A0A8T2MY97_9TELE|nr:hypothetical protein JZ751_024446 [Albula glossodonta]
MASPAKQAKAESDTIVGYLHSVSPVKTSRWNVRYFEANLQTGREEYHRLVAFAVGKRTAFVQTSQNDRAVKLANLKKSVSYSDPGGFDVICSNGSSLEVVEGVQFCRRDPSSMGQMTIGEVLRLGPRQRVGVVEAKILPEGTVSKVVAVDSVQCELKEFQICDPTGQTMLTLWDKQILAVQVSKSYRLAKLATRKAGDRTVLTSTPSTTLSEISAVGQPDSIEVRDDRQNTSMIRGSVNGVQIIGKHRCRRCHSNQEEFVTRASTHRCQRCKLLQRSTSFAVSYSGVLVLTSNGQDQSLSFTNSAICNYLKEKEMNESMKDVEAIEEHFLNIGQVDISVNGEGLIVSIQECAENELGGPVLEADFAGELHELFLEHEEVKH